MMHTTRIRWHYPKGSYPYRCYCGQAAPAAWDIAAINRRAACCGERRYPGDGVPATTNPERFPVPKVLPSHRMKRWSGTQRNTGAHRLPAFPNGYEYLNVG